ncbi:MAG TPA: FAD-binding oxidoreductase [Candidatus Paceibacterota bacterium]|nr:FAD-binding oxidoreductase [Candidatus Paceibacterota bacterium]
MQEEIKKFFKGEIENSEEVLSQYSKDASIFLLRPELVVFPKDSEDVQNLVKWVNENTGKYPNLAITPRCAGTDMSGGSIGESIVMDFTRHMNQILGWSEENGVHTVTVQPGMFYRDFEKATLEKGIILPCYTASKSLNAVGGMYGNNSAGERTLKYGKTEDYVLEAKVVFEDGKEYIVKPLSGTELQQKISQNDFEGEIYKRMSNLLNENKDTITSAKPMVHKNSAGYYLWNISRDGLFDLNRLLVGSQGTLGIATEITFKLVPDYRYTKLVAIFMNDLEPLGRLVDKILEFGPETLETYDDKTLKLAVRFFPDFLKNKGLWGMSKLSYSFLPEFFMMIRGGFPKLVLLAEFEGESEEEANRKCQELKEAIKDFKLEVHVTKNAVEAEKYWDVRRESFALLRKHVKGLRTAPFIDDIIVRPEFLPKFLPELKEILNKYDLVYTIAGHAGDGNFHIIPLMDFTKSETTDIILELSDTVYDLVLKYEGSITAEHNDGIIRTPYLAKMYGEKVVALFAETKRIFDPKNIFNPGKKVPTPDRGGTKEYMASRISH